MQHINVSIIIATRGRQASLIRTIATIESAKLGGIGCELIVVSNGSDPPGLDPIQPIDLIVLHEERAGKSNALNSGIKVARGDLIIFTDDDVLTSPEWISGLYQASRRYPRAVGFCGPIIPDYPPTVPAWLRQHKYSGPLFADFQLRRPEGPLPQGMTPFGPNFSIRAKVAKAIQFRTDLGYSDENGGLVGEETAFCTEVIDRYLVVSDPGVFIYVPQSSVVHCIRSEQSEFEWMMERFFNFGRTVIAQYDRISHSYVWPESFTQLTGTDVADPETKIKWGVALNFYLGQYYQCDRLGQHQRATHLSDILDLLQLGRRRELLSASGRALLTNRPEIVRRSSLVLAM